MSERRPPVPPFTAETARQKVKAAEDAWNSRDPDRVAGAYTVDSVWRNRDEFVRGRDEIKAFLRRKWERELDYRLRKSLWAFTTRRIAVRFQYEWHDAAGQWFRSYGNELWEFDDDGLMMRREANAGWRARPGRRTSCRCAESGADSAEVRVEKLGHDLHTFTVEEQGSAVARPVDDDERRLQPHALVGAYELMGLVDRHLRVLVAVQQQQRRVGFVDVKHRARQPRQRHVFVGECPQQRA